MQVCEEPSRSIAEDFQSTNLHISYNNENKENINPSTIVKEATDKYAWGLSTSIDIYNCNPCTIRDANKIKQFVVELCNLIEMKRFHDTLVVNFGEDERVAGFSMVQLIETSLISAHFANMTNAMYLDVFSCKSYDPKMVEEFAMKFFNGSHCITSAKPRL